MESSADYTTYSEQLNDDINITISFLTENSS